MVQPGGGYCVKCIADSAVANGERDIVYVFCSFNTVAVEASWTGDRGSTRHDGEKSETMGGFPRQKQVSLQWEDHDGSTDGYFLPDLYPHHRDQRLVLRFRVSSLHSLAVTHWRSIVLRYSARHPWSKTLLVILKIRLKIIDFVVPVTFLCI